MKWHLRLLLYPTGFVTGIVMGHALGVALSIVAIVLLLAVAAVVVNDALPSPFRFAMGNPAPSIPDTPLAQRYIHGHITLEQFEQELAAATKENEPPTSTPEQAADPAEAEESIPVVGDWPFRGEGYFIQLTTTDNGYIGARAYLCQNGQFYTPQMTPWPDGKTILPDELDAAITEMKRFIRDEQARAREKKRKQQEARDAVRRYTSRDSTKPESPPQAQTQQKPKITPGRVEGIKPQPTRVPKKNR